MSNEIGEILRYMHEHMQSSRDVAEILAFVKDLAYNKNIPMVTTSFGPGGIVLLYFIRHLHSELPIYFIDTGYHFKETLEVKNKIEKEWGLKIITIKNDDSEFNPDTNLKCCHERKVVPLEKALKDHDIWITAIRKGETKNRENIKVFENSDPRIMWKINPLANWSLEDCWKFIKIIGLPYNKLHDDGYTSIGCEPCTRKPINDNPRSGRWVGTSSMCEECGIHVIPDDKTIDTLKKLHLKTSLPNDYYDNQFYNV